MEPFHFCCPHCTSRLRIREKMFVGRQVNCPECDNLLVIVDGATGLSAEKFEASAGQSVEAARTGAPQSRAVAASLLPLTGIAPAELRLTNRGIASPEAHSVSDAAHAHWWRAPSVLAWGIAGGCAATVAAFVIAGGSGNTAPSQIAPTVAGRAVPAADLQRPEREMTKQQKADSQTTKPNDAGGLVAQGTEGGAGAKDLPRHAPKAAKAPAARADAEDQLLRIGSALQESLELHGHFPEGTVSGSGASAELRLSWLAQLAAGLKNHSPPPVVWERPWQDPLNDAFVRRRIHEFQNLAVPALTGSDGYPATHFAGVSGVGADSARLELPHPRAGIFGESRQTRLEEIRDGASSTMLVVGVQDHLGAWAAGGTATVRGFTREPYLNGPDGMGTGQKDAMFVLMADGSVKAVQGKTDPRIVRRMAAMADGLPLDASVPGEPGDAPSAAPLEAGPPESPISALILKQQLERDKKQQLAQEKKQQHRPQEVSQKAPLTAVQASPEGKGGAVAPGTERETPERPSIDLNLTLEQKILKFQQLERAPLIDVLRDVADMAGGVIDFNAGELQAAGARLDEPVALRIEKTTVREILEALLKPAGLTFRIEENKIHIIPGPRGNDKPVR